MKTIKIPFGPNASLDGGPFFDFTATDDLSGYGVLGGEDQAGNRAEYDLDDVQAYVRGEMETSEPISITTGDVHDPETGTRTLVGCIRVPLWPGYTVDVFDDKTPEKDLSNLSGYSQRTVYEKRLQRHGGAIHG